MSNSVTIFSQLSWVHIQTRRSYLDFVVQFDNLRLDDVRWTPYSDDAVHD